MRSRLYSTSAGRFAGPWSSVSFNRTSRASVSCRAVCSTAAATLDDDQMEPLFQPPDAQLIDAPAGEHACDKACGEKRSALVVPRLDLERRHRRRLVTRTFGIARGDAEPEPSGRQVRVERLTTS